MDYYINHFGIIKKERNFYLSVLEKCKKAFTVTMKAFQNPEDNLIVFSKLLLPKHPFGVVWVRLYILSLQHLKHQPKAHF